MNLSHSLKNPKLAGAVEDILVQYPQMPDKTPLLQAAETCIEELQQQQLSIEESIRLVHERIHAAAKESQWTVYDTCSDTQKLAILAQQYRAGDDDTISELFQRSEYLVGNCLGRWRSKCLGLSVIEELESIGRCALIRGIHSIRELEVFDAVGVRKLFAKWIFNSMRDYTQRHMNCVRQPRRVSDATFEKSTKRKLKSHVKEFKFEYVSVDEYNIDGNENSAFYDEETKEDRQMYQRTDELGLVKDEKQLEEIVLSAQFTPSAMSEVLNDRHFDTVERFIAIKLDQGWRKGEIARALQVCNSEISAHIKTMKVKWRAWS